MLGPASGRSPSGQVKAAAAQVGDLKWNRQKKKVIAHYCQTGA
jgi:hypothetical protein